MYRVKSFVAEPPSPWASPCRRCGAQAPDRDHPAPSAPRLVAFVSARPTTYGGVVELSAALWGGHHSRSVTLDGRQARTLARELLGLADGLDRDAQLRRRARRVAERDGQRPASGACAAAEPRPPARLPVRPTGALDSRP